MHVVHDGRKTYCEQGDKGHWGTCFGTKPEWQYRAELKAWRERNTVRDANQAERRRLEAEIQRLNEQQP